MSVTTGTFPGVRIIDMPDLGAVNDASSVVGERAGSGRFGALALRSYVGSYITAGLPWINVRDWGAKGDGAADDTAAINAAYAAVPATGAVVVFPQGVYLTSAPIVVTRNNTITEGCYSEIRNNNPVSDHFALGSTSGISRLVFRDLSLWASVAHTGGACFRGLGIVNGSSFYNVQCGSLDHYGTGAVNNLWNGYDFSLGVGRCYIDPACVVLTKANGIIAANGAELYIDGRILFCANGCLLGGSIGGVYFNGEISQCGTGVVTTTGFTGATNREIFFEERAIIDSCKDYGLNITAGSVSILDISGSWFTSAGQVTAGEGVGLFIESYASPSAYGIAKINGARFYNNLVTGFINSGMVALVSGCMFNNNQNGAIIESVGANGTMIDGGSFLYNSGIGVTVQNGINDYAVTNNKFLGNGTAIGGDAVGWTNVASQVIRGNSGFPTRNNGAAQILAGSASVTFNHGLPGTPHGAILVSGNEVNHTLAIGTVTATQITVNADTNVTANLSLFWEASMGPFA